MAEPGRPPTTAPGRERQRRRPEGLPRPALGDTQTQREPRGSERELRVRAAARKAVAAAEGRRRGTRGGATGRARAARLSAAAASPQPGRRAPQRVRGL